MPRALRIALAFAAVAGIGVIGACALVYHWANGITPGSVALSSLAFACGFALIALGFSSARRPAAALAALIVVADGGWAIARIVRPDGLGLEVCEGAACDGHGRFWQRVPDEREGARFGLYLSKLVGSMHGAEAKRFDRLLDDEYGRMLPQWRGLPNALLLRAPQRLQWLPPGKSNVPCVVFLHGFGGQLTLYLRAIVDSELGQFGVIAPVLDNFGLWWTPPGVAAVTRTLDELPAQCDRRRVVLAGLSNGGVGVTALIARPELRSRLAAAVLISGAGAVDPAVKLDGFRMMAITGASDPRMPLDHLELQVANLRAAGANVEFQSLDADHFLILTRAPEWTHRVYLMGTSLPGTADGIGSP